MKARIKWNCGARDVREGFESAERGSRRVSSVVIISTNREFWVENTIRISRDLNVLYDSSQTWSGGIDNL